MGARQRLINHTIEHVDRLYQPGIMLIPLPPRFYYAMYQYLLEDGRGVAGIIDRRVQYFTFDVEKSRIHYRDALIACYPQYSRVRAHSTPIA